MEIKYLEARSDYMNKLVDKNVGHLYSSISAEESIHALTVGVFQDDFGVYGLTESRLLFYSNTAGREVFKEFDLGSIHTIKLLENGLYNIRFNHSDSCFRLGMDITIAEKFAPLLTDFCYQYSKNAAA